MARYVRFVVHQKIGDEARRLGLFSAAYHLLDEGELFRHDRVRLVELLGWFKAELPVPPSGEIPSQAIFSYTNLGPFSQRMWELAQLLKEHGFTIELITAGFVGRIVYSDKYQLAALPPTRRHR